MLWVCLCGAAETQLSGIFSSSFNENKPAISPVFSPLFCFRSYKRQTLLLYAVCISRSDHFTDLRRDWQVGMLVHATAFVQAGPDCISHTWRLPWAYQPVISWLKSTQCLILSAFSPDGASRIAASSMNAVFVFCLARKITQRVRRMLTFVSFLVSGIEMHPGLGWRSLFTFNSRHRRWLRRKTAIVISAFITLYRGETHKLLFAIYDIHSYTSINNVMV